LYHLNAEEEPEHEDYPTPEEAPLLRKALMPRGVIHSWATDEESDEVDERYGPVGKQRIEDTGPLTKLRMETIDDETTTACADFIRRQNEADTPFFVWMNMT
ncbi:arylsulfatase, partial [Mycobacterium sp. ITM-2017-0098]